MPTLTEQEFARFQRFIYDAAGITLPDTKLQLVSSRLMGRVQHHSLSTFGEYFEFLVGRTQPQEVQAAVDLLTTNVTYF